MPTCSLSTSITGAGRTTPDEMEADWFIDRRFDSIFEVQRTLYANAVQALNSLQAGGIGALPSLAAAAFAFGMLHALLPGQGKSVLASYYAAGGRWRGAVGSSLLLILTHVGSAVVLVLSGYAILRQHHRRRRPRPGTGAGEPNPDCADRALAIVAGVSSPP